MGSCAGPRGIARPHHRPIITVQESALASPFAPFPKGLVRASFLERPNRFLIRAVPEGGEGPEDVHLPDPGRLRELLIRDAELWIRPAASPTRRTRWTAVLVRSPKEAGGELVSLDTTLPNRLALDALAKEALPELGPYEEVTPEWSHGRSRFDFLLRRPSTGISPEEPSRMVVEVKSVTLLVGNEARFPDAVTERGARHVRELAAFAGRAGWEAAILFVLQRAGGASIRPAREIDSRFADALAAARDAGVRVLGRRCSVSLDGVTLGDRLPVVLD